MSKCVECLRLNPNHKDFTSHKCWCNSKWDFVSPKDKACNEFIRGFRSYFEKQEILSDTDDETLLDIILDFMNPPSDKTKEKVSVNNTLYITNIPYFLDMLLRYAGYDKESNTYKVLENIFSIVRSYDSDYFYKIIDDEYSSIMSIRFGTSFFNEDYRTVSKKMIDKTYKIINAYNNKNYSLVYKEWLIYLKDLYYVFKMDKYMLKDDRAILLRKLK